MAKYAAISVYLHKTSQDDDLQGVTVYADGALSTDFFSTENVAAWGFQSLFPEPGSSSINSSYAACFDGGFYISGIVKNAVGDTLCAVFKGDTKGWSCSLVAELIIPSARTPLYVDTRCSVDGAKVLVDVYDNVGRLLLFSTNGGASFTQGGIDHALTGASLNEGRIRSIWLLANNTLVAVKSGLDQYVPTPDISMFREDDTLLYSVDGGVSWVDSGLRAALTPDHRPITLGYTFGTLPKVFAARTTYYPPYSTPYNSHSWDWLWEFGECAPDASGLNWVNTGHFKPAIYNADWSLIRDVEESGVIVAYDSTPFGYIRYQSTEWVRPETEWDQTWYSNGTVVPTGEVGRAGRMVPSFSGTMPTDGGDWCVFAPDGRSANTDLRFDAWFDFDAPGQQSKFWTALRGTTERP